ncbi:hypothetical protein [Rhodococcus sp. ACS1]|uniref:hypothetical protein n=1 Tax=Rhodococcus sp. ACS1 TaxID=2028570 RepID=UPI00211B77B6|nr:hypothetical protein [Rhodococcus sp. ACS1]
MSAAPGRTRADPDKALPNLATGDVSMDPHITTAPAPTGTDIELRIHTSIAPFDVAAEQWFPAVAAFTVTVIAHPVDAASYRCSRRRSWWVPFVVVIADAGVGSPAVTAATAQAPTGTMPSTAAVPADPSLRLAGRTDSPRGATGEVLRRRAAARGWGHTHTRCRTNRGSGPWRPRTIGRRRASG